MENEITFRTSVGGYRRDEVIEYVESMNEQIFCLKKESEELPQTTRQEFTSWRRFWYKRKRMKLLL